jgi:hypothetical protein
MLASSRHGVPYSHAATHSIEARGLLKIEGEHLLRACYRSTKPRRNRGNSAVLSASGTSTCSAARRCCLRNAPAAERLEQTSRSYSVIVGGRAEMLAKHQLLYRHGIRLDRQ